MASHSLQRALPWALGAATLLFAACQFGDSPADEDGPEEATEPARDSEPNVTQVRQRDAEDDDATADETSDDGEAPTANEAASSPTPSAASETAAANATPPPGEAPAAGASPEPAQAFAACLTDGGPYSDCETIYVTVKQPSPARCIQLTIDNCGTYGRRGLAADAPATWRLAGGSISANDDPCELGAFYTNSASIANASGSITWNETTPRPTALTLNLTLQPTNLANDPNPISLTTTTPLDPIDCEELNARQASPAHAPRNPARQARPAHAPRNPARQARQAHAPRNPARHASQAHAPQAQRTPTCTPRAHHRARLPSSLTTSPLPKLDSFSRGTPVTPRSTAANAPHHPRPPIRAVTDNHSLAALAPAR